MCWTPCWGDVSPGKRPTDARDFTRRGARAPIAGRVGPAGFHHAALGLQLAGIENRPGRDPGLHLSQHLPCYRPRRHVFRLLAGRQALAPAATRSDAVFLCRNVQHHGMECGLHIRAAAYGAWSRVHPDLHHAALGGLAGGAVPEGADDADPHRRPYARAGRNGDVDIARYGPSRGRSSRADLHAGCCDCLGAGHGGIQASSLVGADHDGDGLAIRIRCRAGDPGRPRRRSRCLAGGRELVCLGGDTLFLGGLHRVLLLGLVSHRRDLSGHGRGDRDPGHSRRGRVEQRRHAGRAHRPLAASLRPGRRYSHARDTGLLRRFNESACACLRTAEDRPALRHSTFSSLVHRHRNSPGPTRLRRRL